MSRRTLIAAIAVVGSVGIGVGWFAWRNFRGAAPAVLPPPQDIAELIRRGPINATDIPLTLPPGFSIGIFADQLGKPRALRRGSQGEVLVSVPNNGHILALMDRDGDGVAEERTTVVSGLRAPHGMVLLEKDGRWQLYVAETDRVQVFDYDADRHHATNPKQIASLPAGGNHTSRTLALTGNPRAEEPMRLLVSVGSSCNVCVEGDARRGAILSMNLDGSDQRIFARGLRNSVFLTDQIPERAIWATEMGRDLLGDDLPPDEVNVIEEGKDYGWPYCYGKNVRDPFGVQRGVTCAEKAPSHIDLPAHVAPLGLAFIPEHGWPSGWGSDLLIAYHGSWNRAEPVGYKIVRVRLADDGAQVQGIEDFMTGWRISKQRALGRPVDLLPQPDGTLFISDDHAGVLYRVTYDPNAWAGAPGEGKPADRAAGGCVITGCSGQVCADREVMTTCEFRPVDACYAHERCERLEHGSCGWVMTETLRACVDRAQGASFPGAR
ncbi:PQQ-dependent sugar dehydrogenase [Candidatus Uhrbacteria bacterium]|nr:PQQ-dependent sugar dehydrogenase [Candidatus Uhrbacteria bacterium]